jgi:hypothetical protein
MSFVRSSKNAVSKICRYDESPCMYFRDGSVVYSPSDLTRFMESAFGSWMDRLYLECPDRITPDERDDELQLYADAGITHEAKFVKQLENDGRDLCWVQGDNREAVAAMTREAISEGRPEYRGTLPATKCGIRNWRKLRSHII